MGVVSSRPVAVQGFSRCKGRLVVAAWTECGLV